MEYDYERKSGGRANGLIIYYFHGKAGSKEILLT
jgi:hypothetical protein